MFKDILRWTAIGGIFAVPIVLPFIVSSSMFFPFITGKNFTFRIIVEIITASWVLLALMDARYRPRYSWILGAVALFVLVIGLADFTGANVFKSFWSNFERMEGYVAILHLFGYFLVTSAVLNTEKLWNAFWYSSLGTSVIISFIALKPIFELFPDLSFIPRIDASFGNPIYLGVYSLFHVFIALILMVRWNGVKWFKVTLGLVALLHVLIMVLSQTRSVVLGMVVGAVVIAVLMIIFEWKKTWIKVLSALIIAGAISVFGTWYLIKDTEYANSHQLISRFTQVDLKGGTIHARFMNWGMAWEGFKERPILGWGQGNYEYVFSKYHDPGMYAEEPWFDRTHNIYFDWLVAGGLLGFIAYLLIPLSLFTHLWLLDPKDKTWSLRKLIRFEGLVNLFKKRDHFFTPTERALWTGLIVAYMVHNFFVFDNIISYILFFSVLGYLHFKVTEGNEPLFGKENVSQDTIMSFALPVTIVITGVIIWYVNVPGIQTSQTLISALTQEQQLPSGEVVRKTPEDVLAHYRKAVEIDQLGRQEAREQLVQMAANIFRSEGVNQQTKLAFQELAISEIEKEVSRNPNSARLLLFQGSLYGGIGQIDKAEEVLRRVIEITPTKQAAIYQLGEVLLLQNKNEEALELFKRAYELETENSQAAKLYALALIRNGKDKEAVDLLTEHFGTPYVDDNRLFMEWTNAKRFDIVTTILENKYAENPEDIQVKVSLAAAYKELGENEKAIQLLEEVKETNPEYAEQMDTFIKDLRGW